MSKPRRLLWLDDDAEELFAYEKYVLAGSGWTILWAHSLLEAATLLSTQQVNAVFLDQNVTDDAGVRENQPVWGGCRVLYWLRGARQDLPRPWLNPGEHEPWGDISPLANNQPVPVAMVSSFHDPEVWRVTLAAAPLDVRLKLLSKPIEEQEILTWLEQAGSGDAA